MYLQKRGFCPGDYLILGIPPSPEFYVLFYAAAALGIVSLPVPPIGKISSQVKPCGRVAVAGDKSFLLNALKLGLEISCAIPWDRKTGLGIPPDRSKPIRKRIIRDSEILGTSTSSTAGEPMLHDRSAEVLPRRGDLRIGTGITDKDMLLRTSSLH